MPFINKHRLGQLLADKRQLDQMLSPFLPGARTLVVEQYGFDPSTVYFLLDGKVEDHFHSDEAVKMILADRMTDLLDGPNAELLDRVHQAITDNGGEVPRVERTYHAVVGDDLRDHEPTIVQKLVGPDDTTPILNSRDDEAKGGDGL